MVKKLTYKSSGVDIDKANKFKRQIKSMVARTFTREVMGGIGGFGSLFNFASMKYKNPILVSSSDGVGTKLIIAKMVGKHDTVGIDLVAMNTNDILCLGARPIFFLDYIASGKLELGVLRDVIKGIATGCRQSGCGSADTEPGTDASEHGGDATGNFRQQQTYQDQENGENCQE